MAAPSSRATRLIDTAPSPSDWATWIPAATTCSRLRPRFGPRLGRSHSPQASATFSGSSTSEPSLTSAAGLLGDRVTGRDPDRLALSVATDGSAPQVRALLDEIDPDRHGVVRFTVREATLDDVFLTLTGTPVPAKRQVAHV
ncbi:hypothetical protein [Micromonospora craniellae]|uniref:hypothetical protein n=1 Tax=Micromonospora craniellae TaxID=2294034 RepID=UPI001F45834A|nr:hypothetical protein [Micromonospora craniellae]